jgi:hypothetical protein
VLSECREAQSSLIDDDVQSKARAEVPADGPTVSANLVTKCLKLNLHLLTGLVFGVAKQTQFARRLLVKSISLKSAE